MFDVTRKAACKKSLKSVPSSSHMCADVEASLNKIS